jgi:hypothetical protein
MSGYYIVSSEKLEHHETLEDAMTQRGLLSRHMPGVKFTVHRCKRYLHGAKHFPKMVALLNDILRDGLTQAHRDRADILLLTIKNRSAEEPARGSAA